MHCSVRKGLSSGSCSLIDAVRVRSNNEKFRQLKEIKKKLEFKNEDVFFYSALKNTGREELEEFIFIKAGKPDAENIEI